MLPPQALDPEAIIAVQAAVIAELRAANGALRTQVAVLEAANAEQAGGIAVLEARVAELERRLGRDSSNFVAAAVTGRVAQVAGAKQAPR